MRKKRTFSHIYSHLYLGLILTLLGCVAGEGGKEKASCSPGQAFDSRSRTCQGARISAGAPTPITKSVSILEETQESIVLEYSDSENDFATSCSITTGGARGYTKQWEVQNLRFKNQPSVYPEDITIEVIAAGFNAVSTEEDGDSKKIKIFQASTATTSILANEIRTHPVASTWVQVTVLGFDMISIVPGVYKLTDLPCGCFGGVCRVTVTPINDFVGTTQFRYTISDEDGTSNSQILSINVTNVNDPPVVTLTGASVAATERLNYGTVTPSVTDLITNYISVSDVDSSSFTYRIGTPPTHGAFTFFDPLSGFFSYTVTTTQATDTFSVIVIDDEGGETDSGPITINITALNDPPLPTDITISDFDEDTTKTINLPYTDDETNPATQCVITRVTNVIPVGGCVCAAGSCQVDIRGIPNQNGSASFSYQIFDAFSLLTPREATESFKLIPTDDDPILFPTVAGTDLIQATESVTSVASTFGFTLNGATEKDGSFITSYTLLAAPTKGTLSRCVSSSTSGVNLSSLTCDYTPQDGNTSDSTALDGPPRSDGSPPSLLLSQVATDSGTFYAKTLGSELDNLEVELINVANALGSEDMFTLYGANAKAYLLNSNRVVVLYEAGITTGAAIDAAIDADSEVSKVVDFVPVGFPNQTAGGVLSFGAGVDPVDSFVLRATELSGQTTDRTIYISIIRVEDRPTICEYSSYSDTTACGLNGCIGSTSPTLAGITPDKADLYFYNSSTGTCFKSTAANGTWEAIESHISDRSINELDPIVIDNIKIDEGGGADEDSESLTITEITSSDENLIPLGNIEIFYDNLSTRIATGATLPAALPGTAGFSADSRNFRLVVTPQTINPADDQKSSEIEITVEDSAGGITEVTFTVNVQKVSATHGGWASFSATGPKVDSLGLVNEDRKVCPYSLDQCEGGQSCYGSSTPVNNSSADPDSADAIFMQESGTTITCFRQKRTKLQNIAYVGKTSTAYSIQYIQGTPVEASVSGSVITVTIDDEVTTSTQIANEINTDADTKDLVKAVILKENETQDTTTSATPLAALSNSNWESFETYCNATPSALEGSCSSLGRSCLGQGTPSFVPENLDSRYWDEQNNVCYRSIGTSLTSDWEAYDAPAEVTLSWNPFSVNGSASISEYRIFRRLANEEFDFSKPINRKTIAGTSSSYTYVDNAKNSVTPPAPGTVYYYVVRPVVNGILTSTAAESGTSAIGVVRMMAPPKNMAFAHRWMMNKRVCEEMNRSPDPTNNYRCLYKGPGDSDDVLVPNTYFYDIGKDLLVDRFEAGCPYSPAPACPGTFDNSCIGVGNPNTENIDPEGTHRVYYSRTEGKCYFNASGAIGAWSEFESLPASYFAEVEPDAGNLVSTNPQNDSFKDKKYHRASQPPLVHISQTRASNFCSSLDNLPASEISGFAQPLSHKLPDRRDQIAYSLWNASALNDSVIAVTETGLSLNSSSKCNSSGASGLEDGYVDFDKPDSNDFYSLPGTSASGIRSLATGSNETAACVSIFGVQDAVGNVTEWTSNELDCPFMSECETTDAVMRSVDGGDAYGIWAMDGTRGPCVDSNSDGICDANISSWAFEDERFSAGRFFTPLGIPAHVSAPSDFPTSNYDFFEIGPTSGITSLKLHDDTIVVNSQNIFASASGDGWIATGGSYLTGNGAGVWHLEGIPDSQAFGLVTIQDVTFVDSTGNKLNHTVQFVNGTEATGVSIVGTNIVIDLALTGNTASNVATAVNVFADPDVFAAVTGSPAAVQGAFGTPVSFTDVRDVAVPSRVDVGFRCVIDVDTSDYDE